jgi:3-oxoacyl-[acyl-carrier protein] reductase
MDLGLTGKVALVTAASKGLGKGIALQLAREGAEVAISSRSEEALQAAAAISAAASGRTPLVAPADVSDAAALERLVATVGERFGRIDILVNNAGGPPPGVFASLSDEQWQGAVDLLLLSTVRLTRAVVPGMRERGWGRIVNSTSVSVKQPIAGLMLSNAVRTAVIGLAKTLSAELARDGITVNNLLPGSIYTDRIEQLNRATAGRTGRSVEEVRRAAEEDIPVGRYGTVEEYAAAAAFLASERASYITGVSLLVDGGVYRGLM